LNDTSYENGLSLGLVDYQLFGGSGGLLYQLTEQDKIQLSGSYVNFHTTNAPLPFRASFPGVNLSLTHAFSETLTGTAFGGPSFVSSTTQAAGDNIKAEKTVWLFGGDLTDAFCNACQVGKIENADCRSVRRTELECHFLQPICVASDEGDTGEGNHLHDQVDIIFPLILQYAELRRRSIPMIKVDIINEVSKAADITKVKAEVAVEAVLEAMKDSMMRGERIELRGFGVFQVKPRKRGIGRNPRTGKEVKIPPGRTIRFKPGKDLQNLGQ